MNERWTQLGWQSDMDNSCQTKRSFGRCLRRAAQLNRCALVVVFTLCVFQLTTPCRSN